jgi:triacylglycerol lipase
MSFVLVGIVLFLFFGGEISLYYSVLKKYTINKDLVSSTSFDNMSLEQKNSKEIIYKSTNNIPLTLDLYESNKIIPKGSPVIIYVHGGSWAYGDKILPQIFNPVLDSFREEGYSIISVEYELLDKSLDFNKQVSDIKDSIRWINKNKDIYNFNTNEIGIIGVSAGAHLSLLAAYSDSDEFKDDEALSKYPSNIKYIIDFFGPTDLSTIDTNIAPEVMSLSLPSAENKKNFLSKYSPINYVKEDLPKTLIIHSKNDSMVPYDNSLSLYTKSKELDNSVELLTLENMDHDLSNLTTENAKKIGLKTLRFLLKNSPL